MSAKRIQGRALVFAASLLGAGLIGTSPALAQADAGGSGTPTSPGIPPSQHGWEYDIEVANRLLEGGYLDAAEKDFTKVLTAYPDGSPGIDHAWMGLARVHMARGDTARSRASLSEVLRRDTDPSVIDEARSRYRTLRSEAEVQVNEARRAVFYYEARYHQTSWLNPFGKFFHWLDFRRARKRLKSIEKESDLFDPRFLIEPVPRPPSHASSDAGADGSFTLSASEMAALLGDRGGDDGHDHDHGDGVVEGELPVVDDTGEAAASTEPGTQAGAGASASQDLGSAREAFLERYRDLREALSSGDATRIQEETERYRGAKEHYEALRNGDAQLR